MTLEYYYKSCMCVCVWRSQDFRLNRIMMMMMMMMMNWKGFSEGSRCGLMEVLFLSCAAFRQIIPHCLYSDLPTQRDGRKKSIH
jgi:hypothetical protein